MGSEYPVLRNKARVAVTWLNRILAGAILASSTAAAALAQETIELKVSHLFPNNLYLWAEGGQVMVDEIEKASNGRVKFTIYPSGQLGKDTLQTLTSGIADVGIVIPAYSAAKLPLSSVAELPGLYKSSCEASDKMWAVANPDGPLGKTEFEPLDLRVLIANVQPGYNLFTAKTDPEGQSGIKGLKIRAVGNAGVKTISELGAVPVQVTVSELYDSLSRGTVDGALYNYIGLPNYDLQQLLKYSVQGPRFGGTSINFAIRSKTWDGFPDDIKKIFIEAAAKAHKNLCQWEDTNTAAIRERIIAENGHKVVTLSQEEIDVWEKPFAGVIEAWTAEMKSAGRDGEAILSSFKKAATSQ